VSPCLSLRYREELGPITEYMLLVEAFLKEVTASVGLKWSYLKWKTDQRGNWRVCLISVGWRYTEVGNHVTVVEDSASRRCRRAVVVARGGGATSSHPGPVLFLFRVPCFLTRFHQTVRWIIKLTWMSLHPFPVHTCMHHRLSQKPSAYAI